ncbi:MAG: hypothetical protein ACC645_10675 [Pirellulales bacterium]
MELNWKTSESTSALHAVDALLNGQSLLNAQLADRLAPIASGLADDFDEASIPRRRLMEHLLALSSQVANNRALAETALAKVVGRAPSGLASRIAGRVSDIEAAFERSVPDLPKELAMRREPLRLQWEARGPGLVGEVGRLTDDDLIAQLAQAVVVYPVLGGAGAAHLTYNAVRIEGVLADPNTDLPEVLRLGWLIAQLHLDLPIYSEAIAAERLGRTAQLAMIPPILAAAEEVELAQLNRETLRSALTAWNVDTADHELTATTLLDWWSTYAASRPPWSVAMAALDQMLP